MWSEQERVLAGQILDNKEMLAFLKKLYCPDRSKARNELEAVITLPDEEYGRQMKALVIAEKMFADAHASLKRIALREKEERNVMGVAPH